MSRASKEELGRKEKWDFQFLSLSKCQDYLMSLPNMQIPVPPSQIFGFTMFVAQEFPFSMCQVSVMQEVPGAHVEKHQIFGFQGTVSISGLLLPEKEQISPFLSPFLPLTPWRGLSFQMGSVSFGCSLASPQGLQMCKPQALLSQRLPSSGTESSAADVYLLHPSAGHGTPLPGVPRKL